MKKILLSAMISTVLAGGTLAGVPSSAFHGLYGGGGLTYSKGDFTIRSDGFSPTFSSWGAGCNGFLGYGTVIYGGLYLGGELGLGFDGSRFKDKTHVSLNSNGGDPFEIRLKSKSKLTYNIVGRAGYVFSNFLAYAKIGFEGRSKVSALDDGDVATSVSRNGILLGAGTDYALTQSIFLRAEYTYNFGTRKKISNAAGTFTFHTPTQTILIGGGYKF